MTYKIGIICASDDELEPFLSHIENCTSAQKAMLTIYEGKIESLDTVILFSGVCKVNAAVASQLLIDVYHVNIIINAGTAGGIDKRLNILDTVITTECCYHDVTKDILTEFHPWMSTVWFPSDNQLIRLTHTAAQRIQNKIFWGRSVTGEAFISQNKRQEIIDKYNPLSTDMETAAISHVCYVNHIPFIAIRTITDTAEYSGTDNFEINCKNASVTAKDITISLLKEIKNSGFHFTKDEITYRRLSEQEITRELFRHFERRQEVKKCLRLQNGILCVIEAPFIDEWSEADYKKLILCLKNTINTGGLVYAAFYKNYLKGFSSVEAGLFGGENKYMDLSSLHVSEDMRRRGIGKKLFTASKKWAKEQGAEKLYISAHSAIETQAFYRAMGCTDAKLYHNKHIQEEPFDRQLECPIE